MAEAEAKLVRLRNGVSGAVVETSAENAERLGSGWELAGAKKDPAKKAPAKKAASSKSDT
jgi:hypothetical protein